MRLSKSELEDYCRERNIDCRGKTKADMILAMRQKAKEEAEKEPEEEAETGCCCGSSAGYIYWE